MNVPPTFAAIARTMSATVQMTASVELRSPMSTRNPLNAKKIGAKSDAVTTSMVCSTCGI